MRRIFLALILIVSSCLISAAQITPSADSYTNTATPATNFGAKPLLDVQSASQTTYIQFDLSSIPAGYTSSNVAKASLKLYVNAVTTAGSFNVDYVNGTWAENTITANLSPALGTTIVASVPLVKAQVHDYILIDITPAVGAWLNGTQANDGIALVANSPLNASFDSKESTTQSQPPELDIVFTGSGGGGGTITGVLTGPGSGLTGGGTSGTLNLSLATNCANGQVLVWNSSGWACSSPSGGGTVTAVGLTAPSTDFIVTGSPVTTSGTLGLGWLVAPDPNNTPNAIVKRDASGNFSAGNVTATSIGSGGILRFAPDAMSPGIIAGNSGNAISNGVGGTISGGGADSQPNLVKNNYGTIGGGLNNTAAGYGTFIGGGFSNAASGYLSTAIAGQENTASGFYSTVPGGQQNTAGADYAFAAGRRAKANHVGSLVWADGANFDFASTAANQFNVRATGGLRMVTAIDGNGNPAKTFTFDSTGKITAPSFAGNGSGLTGVSASGLASGTYPNALNFTNSGNSFTGNGSGLTGVSASNLWSGTYANVYNFTNSSNKFTGIFYGGGMGLTAIPGPSLVGLVPLSSLPTIVARTDLVNTFAAAQAVRLSAPGPAAYPAIGLMNTAAGGAGVAINMSGMDTQTYSPEASIWANDDGHYSANVAILTKRPGAIANGMSSRLYIKSDGSDLNSMDQNGALLHLATSEENLRIVRAEVAWLGASTCGVMVGPVTCKYYLWATQVYFNTPFASKPTVTATPITDGYSNPLFVAILGTYVDHVDVQPLHWDGEYFQPAQINFTLIAVGPR